MQTSTQDISVQFYTSVLGQLDYRYGQDFVLVGADPVATDFLLDENDPAAFNLPLTFPADTIPQPN